MIVTGEAVARTICRKLNCSYEEGSEGIGLDRGGELVAGVLYENWNGRSIVCHIFVDGRLSPAYLHAIFHYPFVYLGVDKIICSVAASNAESIKLVTKMGFTREATLSDAHPDGDIHLFTMKREVCRYTGQRYGKKLQPATRA